MSCDRVHWRGARTFLVAAIGLTLSLPAAIGGGLGPRAASLFVALSFGTAALALAIDWRRSLALATRPFAVTLWMLGALALGSASWTVGIPVDAVRWGGIALGFSGLFVAAGVAIRIGAGTALLAVAAVVAFASAALGLWGMSHHESPFAERIGGLWRPSGPYQYPPALAFAQVMVLPVLASAMCGARQLVAGAGAAALVVAVAVIALSGSRLALALGLMLVVTQVIWPSRTLSAPRTVAAAILCIAVGAGVVSAVAGADPSPTTPPPADRPHALALILFAALVAGASWPAMGAALRRREHRSPGRRLRGRLATATLVAVAALGGMAATGALMASSPSDVGVQANAGFTHGRTELWRSAFDVGMQRPAAGHGAGTYLSATYDSQPHGPVRFAHSMPLELLVELGVAGLMLGLALVATSLTAAWAVTRVPGGWPYAAAPAAFAFALSFDWQWHLISASGLAIALTGAAVGHGRDRGLFRRMRSRSG